MSQHTEAYIEPEEAEAFVRALTLLQENHYVTIAAIFDTSPSGNSPSITLLPISVCPPLARSIVDPQRYTGAAYDVPTILW